MTGIHTSLTATLLFGILLPQVVSAGLGITPPYVRNDSLTRNSEYTQEIVIVRGDPIEDLNARIEINVPEANDWFTVDRGMEFVLPQGATQFPIKITATVPDDAKFKEYKGNIRIATSVADIPRGSVSVALGVQIDVLLNVIDKEIVEFEIERVVMHDLTEGRKLGWLDFPGKIIFDMHVKNIGNVASAPSKVEMTILSPSTRQVLEVTENSNRIKKVKPFETKFVTAELKTNLPPGGYIAQYRIFNGDIAVSTGELSLSIAPYGSLSAYSIYGFIGLSLGDQLSVILPLTLLIGGIFAWYIIRRRKNHI